jgi:hypothetical protein
MSHMPVSQACLLNFLPVKQCAVGARTDAAKYAAKIVTLKRNRQWLNVVL